MNHKKRRVNFNLTIDIAKPLLSRDRDSGEQCVPQCPSSFVGGGGGPGSTDFTDIESLSEPIPTTPGGKPQVNAFERFRFIDSLFWLYRVMSLDQWKYKNIDFSSNLMRISKHVGGIENNI